MALKPEVIQKVSIHGHRGSRGSHPENTIPAFEEAVAAGAHVLEFDLQLTADDVPIVSHDPYLTAQHCRYRDGKPLTAPIPIRSLKVKQLEAFECGSVAQARFPEQKQIPGTPIPTLDGLLTWWKKNAGKLEMNIETKMSAEDPKWIPDPTLFARKVIEALRKHGAVGKTILQSFDFRTLTAAQKIEPTLRLSCLFEESKSFCDETAEIGAQWASPALKLVNPAEVAKCHAKKIQVVPWTANNEKEWRALLASEVDAIITDYPRKLAAYLKTVL